MTNNFQNLPASEQEELKRDPRGDPNWHLYDDELKRVLLDRYEELQRGETSNETVERDDSKRQRDELLMTLRDRRNQADMTQAMLAEKLGLSQSALARIESGKGNPTLKTLCRYAEAVGCRLTVVRKPV